MVLGAPDHSELVAAVHKVIGVKSMRKQWVSPMAASKFLHFLNPAVFPVYDTQVIENQVLHVFRPEWRDFTTTLRVSEMALHTGLTYYLKYLCFAAHLLRPHSDAIMEIFSDWLDRLLEATGHAHCDTAHMRRAQAAAFEYIAIGAAASELGTL